MLLFRMLRCWGAGPSTPKVLSAAPRALALTLTPAPTPTHSTTRQRKATTNAPATPASTRLPSAFAFAAAAVPAGRLEKTEDASWRDGRCPPPAPPAEPQTERGANREFFTRARVTLVIEEMCASD